MHRLSKHAHHFGGRRSRYLYHALNGAVVAPGDREALVAWRLLVPEGLDELAELARWYPLRSVWSAFYVGEEDLVLRARFDPHEQRIRLEALDPFESALWRICDGTHPLAELMARAGDDGPAVRELLLGWTAWDRQHLVWLPRPLTTYDDGLPVPVLSHTLHLRHHGAAPALEPADLADYHRAGLTSAEQQLDERETTLSHLYRVPHPALGGCSYGARLARVLRERGASGLRVAEVGAGTGELAAAFIGELLELDPDAARRLRYTIVELSPALLAGQRGLVGARLGAGSSRVRWLRGDAEALPLASGSVDLLLCNEVIAELRVERAPSGGLENTGALAFLAEIARVLAPAGSAFVSEYGGRDAEVRPHDSLAHAEHTIHFGALLQRAQELGLDAELEPLGALLGLDPAVPRLVADGIQLAGLRRIVQQSGGELPVLAYTPEMLVEALRDGPDIDRLFDLRFAPQGSLPAGGLAPDAFAALLVRKSRRR